MPREYRHIKECETEIFSLKEQGLTNRKIGKKFGLTKEQIKQFFKRHNANQRKLSAGIALKKKGRPPKDYVVSEQDKVAQRTYPNKNHPKKSDDFSGTPTTKLTPLEKRSQYVA